MNRGPFFGPLLLFIYKKAGEKMKRLITADAYKWVSERADHIRDKNPDIDEGEEYGIAWKQYKKEHPDWKSKKQKEKEKKKKKKSASRLKRVTADFVYCERCGFDNGDFGYPTKDTVWLTKEELEKENPEHKCPYCDGELGLD